MSLPKLNETFNFDVDVPSLGAKFKARPYLSKEEKILLLANESGQPKQMFKAMVQVMDNCVQLPGKAEDLTIFDAEYVFMQLRAISVGEITDIIVKCQECEEDNELSVNILEEVKFDTRDDYTPKMDLGGGIKIQLKYPTVKQLTDSDVFDAITGQKEPGTKEMYQFCEMIIEKVLADDEQHIFSESSKEERENFIGQFTTEQMRELIKFIQSTPSTFIDLNFECVKCEHKNEMNVRGVQNFFS